MNGLYTGERPVPPDWIDYNQHMMDGYFCVAFAEATEALLEHVGLGPSYREETGLSIYTAESHLGYTRTVQLGTRLRYTTQLLAADAKRLHVFHWMTEAATGEEVATNELMLLHVDTAAERVVPIPPQRRASVDALAAEHAALPVPSAAGRRIAMPSR